MSENQQLVQQLRDAATSLRKQAEEQKYAKAIKCAQVLAGAKGLLALQNTIQKAAADVDGGYKLPPKGSVTGGEDFDVQYVAPTAPPIPAGQLAGRAGGMVGGAPQGGAPMSGGLAGTAAANFRPGTTVLGDTGAMAFDSPAEQQQRAAERQQNIEQQRQRQRDAGAGPQLNLNATTPAPSLF